MSNDSPMAHTVRQQFQVSFSYPVVFTSNAFSKANPSLAELLRSINCSNCRIFPVIDAEVSGQHPEWWQHLTDYLAHYQVGTLLAPLSFPGGEVAKQSIDKINQFYQIVADQCIDRHSVVLAIGGGAMLDAVGYAAATAHRGIRLIRMPTTVLAQNDAGVGVKNGINFSGRKNFVGTFAPPVAVLNDYSFLDTLEIRDKRAGIAEAVKVALIRDRDFFSALLENRHQLSQFETEAMRYMIRRCAELHLQHIADSGDPFEYGSARPLDFGHWAAHKLEELSQHRLRHGEAVAIGIALDSLYSQRAGLLGMNALTSILTLLTDLGFELNDSVLAELNVKKALQEFREHLGGELCITLLTAIGQGVEVNHIDGPLMQRCVNRLLDGDMRNNSLSIA